MIGVVIPAHNEERCLRACLRSVLAAAAHPQLDAERVDLVVVLDSCSDRSHMSADGFPVTDIDVQARSVGVARARLDFRAQGGIGCYLSKLANSA